MSVILKDIEPIVIEYGYLKVTLMGSDHWFFSFPEDCFCIPYYIESTDTTGDAVLFFDDVSINSYDHYLGYPYYDLLKIKRDLVSTTIHNAVISIDTPVRICGKILDGKITLSVEGLVLPQSDREIEHNQEKLIDGYKKVNINKIVALIESGIYERSVEKQLFCNAVDSLENGICDTPKLENCILGNGYDTLYMYALGEQSNSCMNDSFRVDYAKITFLDGGEEIALDMRLTWINDIGSKETYIIDETTFSWEGIDLCNRPEYIRILLNHTKISENNQRAICGMLREQNDRKQLLYIFLEI